jgi:hypothetical protein
VGVFDDELNNSLFALSHFAHQAKNKATSGLFMLQH